MLSFKATVGKSKIDIPLKAENNMKAFTYAFFQVNLHFCLNKNAQRIVYDPIL